MLLQKNEMIFQSKMNMNMASENIELSNHFKKAGEFISDYTEIDVWHSIDKIPSSIIGEFLQLWNCGVIVNGKKIELDETDEYYKIIKS